MSDLSTLQQKIGAAASDHWDTPTIARVLKFQQSHGIPMTGLPDPVTLTTAGVYGVPPEKHGSKLWRDLVTSGNQIPQLGWVALAAGLGGLAYFAFRRQNPKGRK